MKLMLVGTTKKIKDYDFKYFEKAKIEGYTIITWSGGINLFRDIGFKPDYYSFLDPLSMMWNDEMKTLKESKFHCETCLIIADVYDNIFFNKSDCKYYEMGYTCSKAEKKKDSLKHEFVEQLSNNNFKETIKISPSELNINKVSGFVNFYNSFHLLTDPHKDTDKLTSFLIPIALYYFKNVTEIKCLGFGDILGNGKTIGRYMDKQAKSSWVSAKQDNRFLLNYKKNIIVINEFLKKNGIEFNFEYENSYSKHANLPVKPLELI